MDEDTLLSDAEEAEEAEVADGEEEGEAGVEDAEEAADGEAEGEEEREAGAEDVDMPDDDEIGSREASEAREASGVKRCSCGLFLEICLVGLHTCNLCRRRHIKAPEPVYRCDKCDFDLCEDCYAIEESNSSGEEDGKEDDGKALTPRPPSLPPPPWRVKRKPPNAALAAQPQTPPWDDKEERSPPDEEAEQEEQVDKDVSFAKQWAEMQQKAYRSEKSRKRKDHSQSLPAEPAAPSAKEAAISLGARLLGRWTNKQTKAKNQQWHEITLAGDNKLMCHSWTDNKPDAKRTTRITIENGEAKWGKGEVKLDLQSLTSTKLTWVWKERNTTWDWHRGWDKM